MPDTYVIFISEKDVYQEGKAEYVFERSADHSEVMLSDGTHIIYVNGQYRGDDELGWLMHDFLCADPGEMHFRQLRRKAWFLKHSREGKRQMCRLMDELEERGRKEGQEETILNVARALKSTMNLTAREAMNAMGIPAEEQKKYLRRI